MRLRNSTIALLLALLPGTPAAEDRPREASAVVIRALDWRGVHAIPERELEAHIFTRAPSWKPWVSRPEFNESVLERDVARVVALYRRHGYYETRVTPEVEWGRQHRKVRLAFVVEEGPPVRLVELRLDRSALDEPELRESLAEALPLAVGDVFSLRGYGAAKQEVLTRLAEAGRPRARISGGADVDVATREARIDWTVDPGPPISFGPVRLSGLERVKEDLVRREIEIEPGDRFSLEALRRTRERIYRLRLFRSAVVQPRPDEQAETDDEPRTAESWPVDVRVTERPFQSLRVGIGYGTEDLLRGQVSWLHRNFLGGARRLEIALRASSLLASLDFDFEQPRFLDRELLLGTDLSLRRERLPAYEADRLLTRVELSRPLGRRWSSRVAHQFEWNDVGSSSDDERLLLEDPEDSFVLSFFELGLRRSTLDASLDPREGSWLDFSVEPSVPALGSGFGYLKLVAEGRLFRPLGPGVLASRLRIGTIDPFGATAADEVPIVKRFFSGGSTTVRGFEYQKLGPLDVDDDPVGGTSLVEASLEWRFPIWRQLGGVGFVDAGQVDLSPYTWRLDDVFYATGLGLRYRTPVGPLRLDVGYLLNPPDGVQRARLHLSVGQAF